MLPVIGTCYPLWSVVSLHFLICSGLIEGKGLGWGQRSWNFLCSIEEDTGMPTLFFASTWWVPALAKYVWMPKVVSYDHAKFNTHLSPGLSFVTSVLLFDFLYGLGVYISKWPFTVSFCKVKSVLIFFPSMGYMTSKPMCAEQFWLGETDTVRILIATGPFICPHFNLVFRNLDSGARLHLGSACYYLYDLGKVLSLSVLQFPHL